MSTSGFKQGQAEQVGGGKARVINVAEGDDSDHRTLGGPPWGVSNAASYEHDQSCAPLTSGACSEALGRP